MGRKVWVAVDCNAHTNHKVARLADLLKLDIDSTVGKLCRLWAWAKLSENEDGYIGNLPASEFAGIMRWSKKPQALLDALISAGFLDVNSCGEYTLHDWYSMNGKSAEKARKDRERKA